MVKVELGRTIKCRPEEFIEFILDIERYTEVDDKLGRIEWVRRETDLTEFKFRPKMPGLALPQPPAVSRMRLTSAHRIDIALAPPPQNRLNHRVAKFAASFECEPVDDQHTRVTRMISFDFNPLVRWLFEPILRRRLPASVERELRLAQEVFEKQG